MSKKYFRREIADIIGYPIVFLGLLVIGVKTGYIPPVVDDTLYTYLVLSTLAGVIVFYWSYHKYYKK